MVTRDDTPKPLPVVLALMPGARRAAYLASFQGEEQAYTAVFSGISGIAAKARPHLHDRPEAGSDPP
jgi:hypothetical protein